MELPCSKDTLEVHFVRSNRSNCHSVSWLAPWAWSKSMAGAIPIERDPLDARAAAAIGERHQLALTLTGKILSGEAAEAGGDAWRIR